MKDFIIIKSTKILKSTKLSKVSSNKSFSHMILIFYTHKIIIKSKAEFCLSIGCEFYQIYEIFFISHRNEINYVILKIFENISDHSQLLKIVRYFGVMSSGS